MLDVKVPYTLQNLAEYKVTLINIVGTTRLCFVISVKVFVHTDAFDQGLCLIIGIVITRHVPTPYRVQEKLCICINLTFLGSILSFKRQLSRYVYRGRKNEYAKNRKQYTEKERPNTREIRTDI